MAYENEAVKKITATEINEVQEGGGRDLAILVTEADK